MNTQVHEGITFQNTNLSEQNLFDRESIKCTFINCNFSKSDLRSSTFIDCTFNGCDFSLASLDNTGLKDVKFINCKLMGINFSACSNFLFTVSFQNCTLDYSSFFRKKMKKAIFSNCSIKEADFQETDLSMVVFDRCDLQNATFDRTILEKADFRTAINYAFDPELNKIKKAKFSYHGIAGLLAKYNIDIEFE